MTASPCALGSVVLWGAHVALDAAGTWPWMPQRKQGTQAWRGRWWQETLCNFDLYKTEIWGDRGDLVSCAILAMQVGGKQSMGRPWATPHCPPALLMHLKSHVGPSRYPHLSLHPAPF